jgi:hypothetical protein
VRSARRLGAGWEEPGARGSTGLGCQAGFGWVAETREAGNGPEPGHRLAPRPVTKSASGRGAGVRACSKPARTPALRHVRLASLVYAPVLGVITIVTPLKDFMQDLGCCGSGFREFFRCQGDRFGWQARFLRFRRRNGW